MSNDDKEYTLVNVKEATNFDKKVVKKDKQIIETHTTTKIVVKTYIEDEY
ncbi:MAG: hypothetical protein WCI72_01115 [archaeon]